MNSDARQLLINRKPVSQQTGTANTHAMHKLLQKKKKAHTQSVHNPFISLTCGISWDASRLLDSELTQEWDRLSLRASFSAIGIYSPQSSLVCSTPLSGKMLSETEVFLYSCPSPHVLSVREQLTHLDLRHEERTKSSSHERRWQKCSIVGLLTETSTA